MLTIDEATVRYGSRTAVDEVSLAVGVPGAPVTALLGPSGCGKSTLLRAVAGLEPLSSGRVLWDGDDLARTPTHRRGFGMVFQDGQLFGHRDVAGNIRYGLQRHHWNRDDADARVTELLELVGLPGLGSRPVGALSGGQQQRVALARALAPRPRLLLLDEPLSALDRQLRDRLAGDLRRILRDTGTPALIVTHDHHEAVELADTVAVMTAGRIVQSDEPTRLWRRPKTPEVARFLGYSTQIDARVEAGHAQTVLGPILVDCPDGTFALGLRPGSVVIQARGVPALVTGSMPTADGVRITVAVDTGDGELRVDAYGDTAPPDGDTVQVSLNPRRVAVIG
ncbi:ABC transporter related protein OS=Tsukamurella paurometabola (strain ATCC 8368 / DSM / CCUG 35730 / CIP 100753 / JCM 10117 / KCTC 9821 / NBRC 16120 / NCIMB 702349 / NCTC 13040) OX=521096 GN=Tpau_3054 PE=4 SV=1 [Tsukamurella paurometabola]|uniref:ABC-type quaternary amine transporter n=1 Tax=Tsukamurella paurometabola (strain ATCC 8368 / DSM 20162 / CCUG 35730 / CIP 100753 / JCM 10117 / KCTC 9821 / NBRC 16120 / NCIMB 702349 / NCTC 13040) TaxID=521096 RepID=D5UUS9_TSUPD|nr:ABC transporter ATP-binding protein [Tsukamurella paurometabola]ADG79647.1 ABC transporter related protein [Tsukamurella paurometabola DSM 20162]SUP36592.1 Sulfate/thiosulfate import ATP-binding protein CysA [Tsukamurella paurometabola]